MIKNDKADFEEHYIKYNGLWGETLIQLKNRLVFNRNSKEMVCIYCGGAAQTREHCPPRSFFPEHDFPNNLRVLPACTNCNGGFSDDEGIVKDYLNCIYDRFYNKIPTRNYSSVIQEYVENTEKSRTLIDAAERIFMKVAQGLAIYEMADCFGDLGWNAEVTKFVCKHWINQEEWNCLDEPILIDVFPELGSRASNGFFIICASEQTEACSVMWTTLKEHVFSYVAWIEDDAIKVRMILRDAFFVEVVFTSENIFGDPD